MKKDKYLGQCSDLPRKFYLETLLDFHHKMGEKDFWAKPFETRLISLEALGQDYMRTEHKGFEDADAISLNSAYMEYEMRQKYVDMMPLLNRI
jgi:hypothetical protein